MNENEKMLKIVRHPRMKKEKRQKNVRRPRPKPHCLPTLTYGREQSNLGIASESSNCRFIKQHLYSQRNLKSSGKYLYMSGKNANIATENGQRTLVRSPTALSTERNILGKWNR